MVSIGRFNRHWLHVAALGLAALLLPVSFASAQPKVDEAPKAQHATANHAESAEALAPARLAKDISPPKPEAKPDQSTTKNDKGNIELGSWPDWAIVAFTAFLAWLSWRQHELEKRLAADTADSLAIAKQSADAATALAGAAISMQRPWLSVEAECQYVRIEADRVCVGIQLFINNHGNSPAINITSRPAVVFAKSPSRDTRSGKLNQAIRGPRSPAFRNTRSILFPSVTAIHKYNIIMDRAELNNVALPGTGIDADRAIFYFGGVVSYNFKGGHGFTEYLYTIMQKIPDVPGFEHLAICNAQRAFSGDELELSQNLNVVAE